jgi:hypothetical protein
MAIPRVPHTRYGQNSIRVLNTYFGTPILVGFAFLEYSVSKLLKILEYERVRLPAPPPTSRRFLSDIYIKRLSRHKAPHVRYVCRFRRKSPFFR